jgi:hypothetical protein
LDSALAAKAAIPANQSLRHHGVHFLEAKSPLRHRPAVRRRYRSRERPSPVSCRS